jgi:predicted dehydrogenase
MNPLRFAVIGAAGWRAQFFLRVAAALPDRFQAVHLLVRDPEKATIQQNLWKVPASNSLDALLATKPDFVVVSVKRPAAPAYIEQIAVQHGIGVLCETPSGPPELESMNRLWTAVQPAIQKGVRIHVAEQYPLQPMHQARIAVARSGKLGPLTHAQASISHTFHGIAVLRRLLCLGVGEATVNAQRFVAQSYDSPGRQGPPTEEKLVEVKHTIATLQFHNGATGLFDFAGDQQRSWARSPRVIVRGQHGEVHDDAVRYLVDYRTPALDRLTRIDVGQEGNLEGYCHRGVQLGGQWLYLNPFGDARLADDEIAVAHAMAHMAGDAPDAYTLRDSLQDQYLAMLMDESVEKKTTVVAQPQSWWPGAAKT